MHGLQNSRLPKLAPDTILRERLVAWLGERANYPVRLIVAPSGSGKTTTLVTYAGASRYRTAYVALETRSTSAGVLAAIGRHFGLAEAADPDTLLRGLADCGRCEILLDDVHAASTELRATLQRLVYEAPENVTFVYATRTREIVDATRLVSLGLARILDAERLAFSTEEAARFAESTGVKADERELARLLHDTDGWAFALCSALRHAAAAGAPADNAFERWRKADGRLIASFVDQAFVNVDGALADAARRLFNGEVTDEATLDRLEALGMFVRWHEGGFRPYRAIARHTRTAVAQPTNVLVPFAVRLFGKPVVTLDCRAVAWVRRRDAQIFAFIALQPNGRASRRQLIQAFWPNGDRQLAAQSLRSACSTMRRALAEVVGYSALSHYVAFGEDIALNLDLFLIDARRVRSHLRDAETAWANGDAGVGKDHDLAALRLAGGPLLDGDVPPALEGVAGEIESALSRAIDRAQSAALVCAV